jgi:hypothetical protein
MSSQQKGIKEEGAAKLATAKKRAQSGAKLSRESAGKGAKNQKTS